MRPIHGAAQAARFAQNNARGPDGLRRAATIFNRLSGPAASLAIGHIHRECQTLRAESKILNLPDVSVDV